MKSDESKLTDDARSAIRSYLFKLVLPSGAILGIVASVVTFLVQDVATSKTNLEVYKQSTSAMQDLLVKTSNAHAESKIILSNSKSVEGDIKDMKARIEFAREEIDSILKDTKSTASLLQTKNQVDSLADKLSNDASFIKRIDSANKIPVGTIVSSILSPEQFSKITEKGLWVPADGRRVIKSTKYFEATKIQAVPDLRGVFIRGLNEFTRGQKRTDEYSDPEGDSRVAGSFQQDTLINHYHEHSRRGSDIAGIGRGGTGGKPSDIRAWTYGMSLTENGEKVDSKETRPRNIALFYYIKIN